MYKVDFGVVTGRKTLVDLQFAKQNSNIDYDSDDSLFDIFLAAIALQIESFVGYPILHRDEVIIKLKHWETSYDLPFEFTSIASVTYRDSNNALQPLEVEDYDIFRNEITFNIDRPSVYKGPITITGSSGYPEGEIPEHFQDAALLMFSERETFRENRMVKMNTSAKGILRPYKRY